MRNKRLGLLGGTFDPIHYGHLGLARAAREQARLDQVLFIPNQLPPHKQAAAAQPEQRAEMVALAIADEPGFVLSRIELERPGRSYAVDTVAALAAANPQAELFFITGADAILEIDTWYQADRLRGLCRFLAAARPGSDLTHLRDLPAPWQADIQVIDWQEMDISSTQIRRLAREGLPVAWFTPPVVERYIQEYGLYLCGGGRQ